uniref:ADP-ribosylglycohydrolase family protein n=1 Tax=Escherichia coli TaxID=562 RepID=UPI002281F578
MKQLTQAERIAGALYGQMLGDALGMPSELWPRERVKRHFGWIDGFLDGPAENTAACHFKAGQYTDDTAMALALADALRLSRTMTYKNALAGLNVGGGKAVIIGDPKVDK